MVDFSSAWTGAVGRPPPADLQVALWSAWSASNRTYHGISHLSDGLSRIDAVAASLVWPDEVRVAWWFHDAIQDPGASDNEARSAAWARSALLSGGARPETIARVGGWIEGTRRHLAPACEDEAVLYDVDLSVLAADGAAYDRYAAGVRQEYAFVPDEVWRAGRASFLRGLLERPRIFASRAFEGLDSLARANLAREVSALGEAGSPG